MAKGLKISEQSNFWWHKKGFTQGAQAVLNGLEHHLTSHQVDAIQTWISKDLREWADSPDDNRSREPPDFPHLG